MNTVEITLESLLAQEEYNLGEVTESPAEIMLEMMDIEEELNILEKNDMVYEAAKMIRHAKSAKKAKKVVKSKMKARDAKALKAKGKKVLKITKEDEATDGGTGPLPTTSDTNGLTDTDLDAAPDQEVEVTVVDDDDAGTAPEEAVGTEGVDFAIVYEDEGTDETKAADTKQTENKTSFIQKIKDFLKKIGDFIMSVIQRIINFFTNAQKMFNQNKNTLADAFKREDVLNMPVKVIDFTSVDPLSKKLGEAIIAANEALDKAGKQTADTQDNAGNTEAKTPAEEIKDAIKKLEKNDKATIKSSGWGDVGKIEAFLKTNGPEAQKNLKATLANTKKTQMAVKENNCTAIKNAASNVQKLIGCVAQLYSKVSASLKVVMSAALKGNKKPGAKDEPAAEAPKTEAEIRANNLSSESAFASFDDHIL